MLAVLLKKQLTEIFSVFKRKKMRFDVVGNVLTVALVACLIAVSVIVFSKFLPIYCSIRLNGVVDKLSRQFDVLTIACAIVFIIGIASSVKSLNNIVIESEDRKIFATLPIKNSAIYFSNLLIIYLKQIAVCAVTLLPISLSFASVIHMSTYYIAMSFMMCLVFPLFEISVASILCIPFYKIKNLIRSKYILVLLLVTALTALLFWGYSKILNFINILITTGDIRYFFDENTVTQIIRLSTNLYPINCVVKILLKQSVGESVGILFGFAIVFVIIGYLSVTFLYKKTSSIQKRNTYVSRQKKVPKEKSQIGALFAKEIGLILRTPSYAFQYFSMAALMPLMVYFCMGIGSDLTTNMLMMSGNFELAILVILMAGTLTNTFCSTNVSREGLAFYFLKTLPIPFQKVLGVKIVFCSLTAILSNAMCCIVVVALNYVTWGQGAFVFFVSVCMSGAQICFATRRDLNHPHFSTDEDGEVRETNSTVSTVIIAGLLFDIILGGASFYYSLSYGSVQSKNAEFTIMLCLGLTVLAVLAASVSYLLFGLKQRYNEMMEGNV